MNPTPDAVDALYAMLARHMELKALLERETSDQPPTYVGLLGYMAGQRGEFDPLGEVGLGFGGSRRARELVIKGLIAESASALEQHTAALKDALKRGPGRPTKEISLDARRAHAVLNLRESLGRDCRSFRSLIDLAIQVEDILVDHGEVAEADRMFGGMTTFRRLQSSVSTGLRAFGLSREKLFGKSPRN